MFLFHTDEVRWFFSGQVPPDVAEWFAGRCDPVLQPERTDLYLTGLDESVGIKLREGRLEVKQRRGAGEAVRFGGGVEGLAEGWTKWGFGLAEADAPRMDGDWLPVTKTRWLRFFEVSGEGDVTSLPRYPNRGGGLELTEVSVPSGEVWWTIGVEVLGPDEYRRGDMDALVAWLMAASDGPELPLESSMSYPGWMVRRINASL